MDAQAHFAQGAAALLVGNALQARAHYEQAIAIAPQSATAHFNYGCILLLLGEYEQGWLEYQWRSKFSPIDEIYQSTDCPVWTGAESLQDKTIVVWGEQGAGDKFQFVRYVPLLKQKGASRVIYSCQEEFHALFGRINGMSDLVGLGSMPAPDFHCPLLGLPPAFGTTLNNIPSPAPYLVADPEKMMHWRVRLLNNDSAENALLSVGLAWRGNAQKTLDLTTLLAFLPKKYRYVCLQKDVTAVEREQINTSDLCIELLSSEIQNWDDTAALCKLMDVVVSVDTGVAHLSAAQGVPTWILLTPFTDWRWLLERTDSPWYASVRLWRHEQGDQWPEVVQRLSAALDQFDVKK